MREFDFEKMPIVEIANEIIMDAVRKNASDIHMDDSRNEHHGNKTSSRWCH